MASNIEDADRDTRQKLRHLDWPVRRSRLSMSPVVTATTDGIKFLPGVPGAVLCLIANTSFYSELFQGL